MFARPFIELGQMTNKENGEKKECFWEERNPRTELCIITSLLPKGLQQQQLRLSSNWSRRETSPNIRWLREQLRTWWVVHTSTYREETHSKMAERHFNEWTAGSLSSSHTGSAAERVPNRTVRFSLNVWKDDKNKLFKRITCHATITHTSKAPLR